MELVNYFELDRNILKEIVKDKQIRDSDLFDILKKIYDSAIAGNLYVSTGCKISSLKVIKEHLNKKGIKIIDKGNEGSGSAYTSIIISWE